MLAGAPHVCSNSTDAAEVLDLLERTRPTQANGFAASVAHLAKDPSFPDRDLRSLRRGNLWPNLPDDIRPADPELRHNMLGTTETGSVCVLSEDQSDQPEHRRGSFGRPAPGFETRIVDPDTGTDCGPGETGELWLCGPFMMEGYYGRERGDTFDADDWYHSGDLFTVDDDGFHYFKGRHSEMIKPRARTCRRARSRPPSSTRPGSPPTSSASTTPTGADRGRRRPRPVRPPADPSTTTRGR
ncbi:hypothetical protein BJF79_02035 [Actinomadura sp. CNU-125]|nr:hypothetical protein BJF79_02035 [Actinomadura sp. CNU-125]